jgi:hypothetical protein
MEKKITWKRKNSTRKWGMTAWLVKDKDIDRAGKIEKKIAKALKVGSVKLSPELETKLLQAAEGFIFKQEHLDHLPGGAELKELVQNLKNSARAFIQSLEDVQHPRIKRAIPLPVEMKTAAAIKALMAQVNTWEQAAAMVVPEITKGRKPDAFLLEMILQLKEIYESATGKPADPGYFYYNKNEIVGDFPKFVAGILDALGPPVVYQQGGRALVETLIPQAFASLAD